MAADKLHLAVIAITEHIGQAGDRTRIGAIRSELSKHPHVCRVLVGGEIDVDRNYLDGRLVVEQRDNLDYVIGAIHYLPGTDILPHCKRARPLPPDEVFSRWRTTLLGLAASTTIDTIAHPGVMIANSIDDEGFPERVLEVLHAAALISAEHGVAWELNNLTGAKLPPAFRREYYKVIQSAVDAGVRLVYGSDAHRPADVGNHSFVEEVNARLAGKPDIGTPPARA